MVTSVLHGHIRAAHVTFRTSQAAVVVHLRPAQGRASHIHCSVFQQAKLTGLSGLQDSKTHEDGEGAGERVGLRCTVSMFEITKE